MQHSSPARCPLQLAAPVSSTPLPTIAGGTLLPHPHRPLQHAAPISSSLTAHHSLRHSSPAPLLPTTACDTYLQHPRCSLQHVASIPSTLAPSIPNPAVKLPCPGMHPCVLGSPPKMAPVLENRLKGAGRAVQEHTHPKCKVLHMQLNLAGECPVPSQTQL